MLVSSALLTNDTSPVAVDVRLGAENELKKLESKRMEPLTVFSDGTLKLETLEIVMLAIQIRLGKLTWRSRPLALMFSSVVRLASAEVYSTRRRLLLMSIESADTTSMPSRLFRNVSLTTIDLAVLRPAEKVRTSIAVSDTQVIEPTDVRLVKARVDSVVRFCRWKLPEIDVRVSLFRLLTRLLLSRVRSPLILVHGPRSRVASVWLPMTTLPVRVVHDPRAEMSAWELIVKDFCVQMSLVAATCSTC